MSSDKGAMPAAPSDGADLEARSLPPVRPARASDAATVATLYNATLGDGYLSPVEAADAILDASGRTCWFVAEAGGAVVAAADAAWALRGELPAVAPPGFEDVAVELLELAPRAERFGLLENIGVLPEHRRRGFAAALTRSRLDWLRGRGVEFVYTFAWHTPEGIPARHTLLRAGFRPLRELPDFYLEDGLRNGYSCPWCGAECHCSALLCVRELKPAAAEPVR